MGLLKNLFFLTFIGGVSVAILTAYLCMGCKSKAPEIASTAYWGPKVIKSLAEAPKDDEKIYKFRVNFPQSQLDDLKKKLAESKFVKPVEDSRFQYGFNHDYLKQVVEYWRTKFDWRKQEAILNQFDHYKTKIEGIDVHFMHAKKNHPKNVKVLPLLMVHGWPGSVVEFLDIAPILTTAKDGIAFEVIMPSIPGYAFSEASHKQGLDTIVTGRMFVKLMKRLGFDKFYIQGGDWGSAVVSNIATYYPDNVLGLHLNVVFLAQSRRLILYQLMPSMFKDAEQKLQTRCMQAPFWDSFTFLLQESGYMHLQATKPDTVGAGLLNSPVGLAAYILEKFSTWTNRDHTNLLDGGLTKKFTLDRLLTNIMIYHLTESIVTSQRYYKENAVSTIIGSSEYRVDSSVPCGIAISPEEISCVPKFVAVERFPNITTYTYLERGGHFLAMEEPQLLNEDIRSFVLQVEKNYPRQLPQVATFKFVSAK